MIAQDSIKPDELLRSRITIVGAGAIGGTVGAYLAEAGYNVLLVDSDSDHVAAIRERGLRITGCRGDNVFQVKAAMPEEVEGQLQVVFLCVKGHHTASALDWIDPRLSSDGYVLSLQNGLNEVAIMERVGARRTVGTFVHFGADLLEPGVIQLGYEATIRVGELDGFTTPRLDALVSALSNAMPAEPTDNLWGYLWGKLVFGSLGFLVSCVDAPVAEVLDDELGRELARKVCREAYLVARTQVKKIELIGGFDPRAFAPGEGWEKRADTALKTLATEWRRAIKQHMGIWRDLRVRKRKTEVDEQVGQVVATGREFKIPTPVNEAVLDLMHEIESGDRGMEWDNLREIERRC